MEGFVGASVDVSEELTAHLNRTAIYVFFTDENPCLAGQWVQSEC
jgi:hypothetical protein